MRVLLAAVAFLVYAIPAASQTTTSVFPIRMIRTGWNADSFAIVPAGQDILNPANCPIPDGYVADSSQPGYLTYLSILRPPGLFFLGLNVVVHNSECGFAGRPKLIGMNWMAAEETGVLLIRTGWNADSFAVVTVEPIGNPANCPNPDGYASDISQPGYKTHLTAAFRAIFDNTAAGGGYRPQHGVRFCRASEADRNRDTDDPGLRV